MASTESDGPVRITDFEERQQLKLVEDRILDLLIIMESTLDTIDSLSRVYREFCSTTAAQHPDEDLNDNDLISFGLAEKRRGVLLYRRKIEALLSKLKSTTKLVSTLYSISLSHTLIYS